MITKTLPEIKESGGSLEGSSRIYDENGVLIYCGETKNGKPYGKGTVYYPDGKVYQEGIFGIKGLVNGREYYPDGKLRMAAVFKINRAYGPNYPVLGYFYSERGNLVYSGCPRYHFGGAGYPIIIEPKGFGPVVKSGSPHFVPYLWENEKAREEEYVFSCFSCD